MDYSSLPSSSVHGILQARIPEWVASPFSNVGNSLMVNNSNNNPLQVKATPLPVESGPWVPSCSLWFRGSGVAGSKSSKSPSCSLGGENPGEIPARERAPSFQKLACGQCKGRESCSGRKHDARGRPMARDDPESPGQGETECHHGPGGGQGNPRVGSFPPEPIPLPPEASLACSLGGQTAS